MGRLIEKHLTGIIDEDTMKVIRVEADTRAMNIPVFNAAGDALVGPDGVGYLDIQKQNRMRALSSRGTTVLDFGLGSSIASSTSNQSSCTAVWDARGWVDGTGCLTITPTTDSFSEFRIYFDSSKEFSLWGDDGYAIEWAMPNIEDKSANPSVRLTIGTGASSTSTPTNTRATQMFAQASGTVYSNGRRYDRQRWDYDATDAKAGVFPGYAPALTGAGVSQTNKINWLRFEMTKFGGKAIKIKRLVRGGSARPCVVISTDAAAFDPLNDNVNAYMSKLGWNWSINQYLGGGNGIEDLPVSKRVINSIVSSGNDFNLNDVIDRNLSVAGLTEDQVYAMARQCSSYAATNGWSRGTNIFVYNNNGYNDTVVAGLSRAGVVAGRAGIADGRFVFTEGEVVNPMRIPAATWDQLTSAQITAQIDRLMEYGATQWVYFHNVYSKQRVADDGQTAVGSMTPSAYAASNPTYCIPKGIDALTVWWEDLKMALDYIKAKESAGLIDVLSPSQWCRANGLASIIA